MNFIENPFHADVSSRIPTITQLGPSNHPARGREMIELQTNDILKVELRACVGVSTPLLEFCVWSRFSPLWHHLYKKWCLSLWAHTHVSQHFQPFLSRGNRANGSPVHILNASHGFQRQTRNLVLLLIHEERGGNACLVPLIPLLRYVWF